ncbi:MAG: 50S ribosomal protein L11 methyltransferase [Wenzhouxiangella sp.]|jgi:ribosomal protein L11 methyltransferase|nr:50S ribosomal protein L11 methyltransferase [Wenzhouxiangella sp.]
MNRRPGQDWLNLQLTVAEAFIETTEELLFSLGASAVSLLDAADHPLHEPDPGQLPMWPQVRVQALFDGHCSAALISEALVAEGLVDSATAMEWSTLADRDWTRAWMDRYRPMRFGKDLWICPSHLEPDQNWTTVIRMDPGLAFGSGTHPTTALCLDWIDSNATAAKTVVDFGCGSGVLAIAAALKGADEVIAVDHDPQALIATMDNACRNGVTDRIKTVLPSAFDQLLPEGETADVVLANILAGPLVDLSSRLSGLVADGGTLVLSGILPEQAGAVAAAYEQLDASPAIEERDGWVRIVLAARR